MAILTTLESFTGGAEGGGPGYGALLMDANGDLFGTTTYGGTGGGGTVFELVNTGSGYAAPVILASFSSTTDAVGNTPFAGLTMDANGDLFGVNQYGGSAGSGTVFEIANTGSGYAAVQTLASFTGANGASPSGALLMDANGDLFGTTQYGGQYGVGTVFELVHTASGYAADPVVLATFNYTNGDAPTGPLIADANGDLFGTTQAGGTGGGGTVFEMVHGASGYTLQTLANFDGSSGSILYAGLTMDAQGNLFGAADSGGSGNSGTVFELVNTGSGYAQPVAIATLDYGTTGGFAIGGLTIDAQGDIFGTAMAGGVNGFGTVFELVPGASGYTLNTLYSFGGADGAFPEGGLILDSQGNLYGTTSGGGAGGSGSGTVFEISFGTPNDGGAAEQANLDLTVNGGSGAPIGPAGEGAVAFTVTGLQAGDTGVVTFTDQANHTVTVDVAAGQTQYTANFSTLSDGVITSSLQVATNSLGDSFTPVAGDSVTLDTTPPAQPAEPGDAAVGNGYVNAAHDTAGQAIGGTAEAGSLVTIYDNGTEVTAVLADGTGAWSWQVGVLADGSTHSYTVTATDAAGNVSLPSDALSFTVDTTPPVKPAAPADAAVHDGWVNAAGDTAGQTIGGATEAGATVAVYDNGALVATVLADGAGAWSYQVGVLADGSSHSYAVTATDAAGNVSAMSEPLSFTVDTTPPPEPAGLADAAIANGYVNAAGDTTSQSLTGTAEAGAVVTVYDNGAVLGTTTANATTGAWTFTLGVLADGAQSLTAKATDAAGNTGAPSAALTFTVDATPPVPVVDNVTSVAKGYTTVSGTSEAGSTVTLSDNGQQVGVAKADANGAWSVTLKLNGGQVHAFTETAVDLALNPGASTGAAYWANPANKALVGATGNDVFVGVKGDTLTGGAGHNHFVFDVGFGAQTVTNFAGGSDQLWFDHTLFADAAQVIAHAHQSGSSAVITDAAGDQVVLQNVLYTALQAGDFHFF